MLFLEFLSLGLLGPSDPVAPCVFKGFSELVVDSKVVFWAEGGLFNGFVKFGGILALGSSCSLNPWDFWFDRFVQNFRIYWTGPDWFRIKRYGTCFMFWGSFPSSFFRDHFFQLLSGPCSHCFPRGFLSWG